MGEESDPDMGFIVDAMEAPCWLSIKKPAAKHTVKLMKETGVQVRYRKKYKTTTNSNHDRAVFENVLDRQFSISTSDQAYVSDITYIPTQEGWLYLAVIIDLFSKKVVGWSMNSRMKAALVCDALKMALW